MNTERLNDLARAYLKMAVNTGSGIKDDGVEAKVNQLAFSSGVEISNGEIWTPSVHHMQPGDANHMLVTEALHDGRLVFTCEHLDSLMQQPAPEAFDALALIAKTLLEQCRPLPAKLSLWVADNFPKPKRAKQHGPSPAKNMLRNQSIVTAVYWMKLAEPELSDRAIFRAVAKELVSLGFPVQWDAVRKEWEKMEKLPH
jgi:hypothetical protein